MDFKLFDFLTSDFTSLQDAAPRSLRLVNLGCKLQVENISALVVHLYCSICDSHLTGQFIEMGKNAHLECRFKHFNHLDSMLDRASFSL